MTATTLSSQIPALARVRQALLDGTNLVRRDLDHLRYTPSELIGALVFPVIMVVLFGYVFGSAIDLPGNSSANYREFLMPGLFAFAQVSALGTTALATADDAAKGVMDRFRSMPIARAAVPFGRTGAVVVTAAVNLVLMSLCGLVVGWRIHTDVVSALGAYGLLILTAYALSWIGVYLGLLVDNPNTADNLVPLTFPITMIANVFVPPSGMPAWLEAIANWNPVSCVVAACRHLFGNPTLPTAGAWPLEHPEIATLVWCAAILALFVPLAVRRYARSVD